MHSLGLENGKKKEKREIEKSSRNPLNRRNSHVEGYILKVFKSKEFLRGGLYFERLTN